MTRSLGRDDLGHHGGQEVPGSAGFGIGWAWTNCFSELNGAVREPGQEAQMSRSIKGHLSGEPSWQGASGLERVGSEQIRKWLRSGQMLCWGPRGDGLPVEATPCH